MQKTRALVLFAVGLLAIAQATADEPSDKVQALAKEFANPKLYDLDPAEWFDGIWSDPVGKDEIFREYFVNKHHLRANTDVLVWVYMERLFKAAPAKLERQRWQISCADEAGGVETILDANGTAHVSKTPQMVPIQPDSAAKLVMEKVCSKQ